MAVSICPLRRVSDFGEADAIRLHGLFCLQGREGLMKDLLGARVRRRHDAIVHPLAFAACGNDAGLAQIGEMAGDFGLRAFQDVDQVADADFPVADEVENAQASDIGERLKETFEVEWGFSGHVYIFALTYVFVKHIFG